MLQGSLSFENVVLVSLSGIPGVGKSTAVALLKESNVLQQLLDPLEKSAIVRLREEPSALWRQRQWTTRFYANPKERALSFQNIVFITHVEAVRETVREAQDYLRRRYGSPFARRILLVVERCMWDQLLFWKVQGSDDMDDDAYMMVWREWNAFVPRVQKILFFETSDIEQTMARVRRRNLREELSKSVSPSTTESSGGDEKQEDQNSQKQGGLTLEYQTTLYNKHCAWYSDSGYTRIEYTEHGALKKEHTIECARLNVDMPYHDQPEALQRLAETLAAELKQYI